VTAVEVDHTLGDALTETLRDCERTARELGTELSFEIAPEDFVAWGAAHAQASLDAVDEPSEFDVVIQNPPYGKVQRGSAVRHYLSILGVDVPNVYAAFLAMSTRLLAANGQIVAITPRSFCNGTYFRSFRRDFLHRIGLDKVSVFHERDALFADSAVLQETIVFSGTLGSRPDKVVISTARGYLDRPHERVIPYTDLVVPGDPEQFIRIPTDAEDDQNAALMAQLPATLDDLGVQVSTGRVVDFRALEFLRMEPEDDTVPLIYPHHFRNGAVVWPVPHAKKANAIQRATGSEKLLLPAGVYVLVKRLSSKEETRRVVSAVYDPQVVSADAVGFENHLNVFHARGVGMDPAVARGLSAWLSSSALDLHFRQFSGHTQVNATDLRNMRYPAKEVLAQLGRAVALDRWPEQARIDELVRQHVLKTDDEDEGEDTLSDNEASIVDRARQLLAALGFDAERCNERSALVLLALAKLKPGDDWTTASNPLLRIVEIMDFLRQEHGRDYKPNTRETIRRQTLHQFADAGLVVQNPGDPKRPINSPKWCYQLTDRAVGLIRTFGGDEFDGGLSTYLTELPGLRALYFAEREMLRIPVTLPGGKKLDLSVGGQNELIADMIHRFCPYYTPGGVVLYVGDADNKWQHAEIEELAKLGVTFDDHGKMPDLVVYHKDKEWLVLMEAASSHGPVDAKRHNELKTLFSTSTVGLVFVSCFPTRVEMRKYLKDIAWETEVWCADAPTHLIHFNGERFLGPYGC
jgi:adenine-specific DNA-methyltransferase